MKKRIAMAIISTSLLLFLFYFRDGTFECIAKSYEFKKCE